ncbi:hypothetical protein [Mycobacterium sp. 1164966.3]|uniref:hypothetical protein n=1 Tax=Mycobacterium sp. 1164966.3 TaxID=1856861 RepID=UPI0009EF2975|nr:hypothetical protein [Mycobacterium sp. 1164966.3]
MSATKANANGGFGGVLGLLFLIAIIVKFFWWIVGALVLIGLFFLGRSIAHWHRERAAEYARYTNALAARADEQHSWVLQGDDRGIYGVEGAKLMHYLYPALDAVKRPSARSGRSP